mmetsp:Transcript_31975/g.38669  ORF Transcript_31975/g.38669 Transcript_31975/m.38669 type:complete len:507 (-) Transcript_31975:156-1676(-)
MMPQEAPPGPPPAYDAVMTDSMHESMGSTVYEDAQPFGTASSSSHNNFQSHEYDSVQDVGTEGSMTMDCPHKVEISDPEKHGDSISGYTSYRVTTNTIQPEKFNERASFYVMRRYSDFDWLHNMLRAKYAGIVIPPLPEKKNSSSRFDNEFVNERQAALQKFLNKVICHPELVNSADLVLFLSETNTEAWAAKAPWYERGTVASMMSSMGHWFGHMRIATEGAMHGKGIDSVVAAEDPEYLEVVDYFLNLEGRLRRINDNVTRLADQYNSMGGIWGEFGSLSLALGSCETEGAKHVLSGKNSGLGQAFTQLGDTCTKLATPTQEQAKRLLKALRVPLKEYLAVILSVKDTIDDRTAALQEYQNQCSKYEERQSKINRVASNQSTAQSQWKTDRVTGLEAEVAEAASARDDAKSRYDMIVERMKKELPSVYREMTLNLNNAMSNLIQIQVALAKDTASTWETLLPGSGQINLMPVEPMPDELEPEEEPDVVTSAMSFASSIYSGDSA